MTRAEVIAQARESSGKLRVDPDLLELMAIRIWDAALSLASKAVSDEIEDWERAGEDFIRRNGRRSVVKSKDLLWVTSMRLGNVQSKLQEIQTGAAS